MISPSVFELTGWLHTDFLAGARNLDDLVLKDDRKRVSATRANALRESAAYELEYRIVTASGEIRYVEERGRCAGGNRSAAIYDVNERKQAELELAKRARAARDVLRDHFRPRLLQGPGEPLHQGLGRAARDAFGLSGAQEVIGKTDFDFFSRGARAGGLR